MTEPTPASPVPPAAATSRGVKIALALSVAVNLGIAGLALGAWLGDGPRKGMPRELSFGPFSEALSDADRRAIREDLVGRAAEFRASREAARAELETLLVTLRAKPFDVSAMQAALLAIETRHTERLQLGRDLIEGRLVQMDEADRLAFADRLEKGLRRGKKN